MERVALQSREGSVWESSRECGCAVAHCRKKCLAFEQVAVALIQICARLRFKFGRKRKLLGFYRKLFWRAQALASRDSSRKEQETDTEYLRFRHFLHR